MIFHSRDRFRTTVNVCGDCFGAAVVEHLSKKDLMESATITNHVLPNPPCDKMDASLLSVESNVDQTTML